MAKQLNTQTDLKSSLTQVFKVTVPEGITGVYISRLDLYFKSKSPTFGLELFLVEITDGTPDLSRVVPNSRMIKQPEDVFVSADASLETSFLFSQLVFLEADTRYAFVIRALGGSPDYDLWVGVNGDHDVKTGATISSNPLSEEAYFAKSQQQWAQLPNEDLKYKIWRAKFKTDNPGYATFNKGATELITVKDIMVASGLITVRAGDEVFGIDSNGLANTQIYAKVVTYNQVSNQIVLCQSTGKFTQGMEIIVVRANIEGPDAMRTIEGNAGMIARGHITRLDDFPIHAIVPKFGNKSNSLTSIKLDYRGTWKNGSVPVKETLDSDFKSVVNHEEYDFWDKSRYALSRSSEVSNLAGNSSIDVLATMTSTNDFVTPVIDLNERSIIALQNLINANTAGEDGEYGGAQTRYISKVVTLADGQEAEDIKVYITAYKPPRTDALVYVKLWNQEDAEEFDVRKWTLMTPVTPASVVSDPKDTEDYREYEFDLPSTAPVAGAAYLPTSPLDAPVRYETNNGVFLGFKKYSIKVVMTCATVEDAVNYPRLSDIRAIALQR